MPVNNTERKFDENVKNIDYHHLAALSDEHKIPFDKLCRRAEKGLPLFGRRLLIDVTGEWTMYRGAAKILGCSYSSLCSVFAEKSELPYWGVEWKSRSMKNPESKRGCGVYFKIKDLELIRSIRDEADICLKPALKVHQAMVLGRI